MSIKDFLEGLTLEKAPGPSASFTVFDLIKALELVSESGAIGRGRLAEKLGLGEGATRTLLARLADAELVSTSRRGCMFTGKGKKVWNEVRAMLPRKTKFEGDEFAFAAHSVALLVKDRSEKIKKGLEQRDAAVRVGAKGATTLIFKESKLALPGISTDVARDYPQAFRQITRLLKPQESDVVIISSADQLREAEYGALAAAWTIV